MAKRATTGESKRLTDVELELMTILWRLGEGAVSDVIGELPPQRELAYTSVSTILRILETKGVLAARKEGRGHIYVPLLGKSEYEARAVKDVVDRVFQGVPVAMVRQLLDNVELSATDLREVRKLLDRPKGRK
ncbi:MAG: putative transcriptional regulator [Steroidobacteraceae bacterium]|jgi:predicted transcriptional regulator|nr:putative transcriptional regulator [Steroidobacteraceae bacterium]